MRPGGGWVGGQTRATGLIGSFCYVPRDVKRGKDARL